MAKDIVQETYLDFHNHYKDPFVTSAHLYNFIRICLYRKYLNSVNRKRSSYTTRKNNNITDLDKYGDIMSIDENFDLTSSFLKKLNDNQKIITPERQAEIKAYLIKGTNHICHTTNRICRGARNFQLQIFYRLGLIEEETDEALYKKVKEAQNNGTTKQNLHTRRA